MWLMLHVWLTLTMSIVYWSKVYMTLRKRRMDRGEKWIDLALEITLATIFSIAFIDLFFSIPDALKLIALIKGLR